MLCKLAGGNSREGAHVEARHLLLDVVHNSFQRSAVARLRLLAQVVQVHMLGNRHLRWRRRELSGRGRCAAATGKAAQGCASPRASRLAKHCRKFVLPEPFWPSRP